MSFRHVMVIVNQETKKLDIVLQWPICSPIGPRLVKRLEMPEYPTTGYTDIEEALGAAGEFDKWLVRQDEGDTTKAPEKEKAVAKKNSPEPLLQKPPPTTPAPASKPPEPKPLPHAKPVKQADMFADLD